MNRADKSLEQIAHETIASARKVLGGDIALTDLLLDNMPELGSVAEARQLLAAIGEDKYLEEHKR